MKNGKLGKVITRSPVSYADFITDHNGQLRVAVGVDNEFYTQVYIFDPSTKDWSQLNTEAFGGTFTPLTLDDSGENLLVIDNNNQDKTGIFSLNLNTGKATSIYTDEQVDITGVTYSSTGNNVYAARIDPDFPTYVMFNARSDEAKIYKELLNTFKGFKVNITSQSKNGELMVLHVSNDINPASFYLYKPETKQLSLLFSNFSHIDVNHLSSSQAIKYEASDGQMIHGYYTHPISVSEDQAVPMVVLVHGGPHSRDYWTFDREVQLLTTQGYGVLRVNFRGSDGYGNQFQNAGKHHWGDRIQMDIIEGTKWAQENLNIDSSKTCIMGASFGGYSAVQSATIAPDLYQCVVANAGVYDLELMFKDGDIQDRLWGKSFLVDMLGEDEEKIKTFSPVNNVDKLNAPILIAHGKKDRRVPVIHANRLKKALDKHNKPYEWFVKSSETHGFYDEENRAEYYEKVTEFLATYLR